MQVQYKVSTIMSANSDPYVIYSVEQNTLKTIESFLPRVCVSSHCITNDTIRSCYNYAHVNKLKWCVSLTQRRRASSCFIASFGKHSRIQASNIRIVLSVSSRLLTTFHKNVLTKHKKTIILLWI